MTCYAVPKTEQSTQEKQIMFKHHCRADESKLKKFTDWSAFIIILILNGPLFWTDDKHLC